MKHWIILFTPETYEVVKEKSLIGVRSNVWKSFSENMKVGDRFISYVSKKMTFDGFGTIAGEATFEETQIFHEDKWFPCRRKVKFEKTGLNSPSGELFHDIAPFNEANTGPGNYLMCKGGFVEVSKKDFDWLSAKIAE
ncbi:MAG: EVE domain-containing protein [Candidatus Riflebacteria bacterium]|nr:EVE domain-containing protein [Candidatus Riflebacteria bacterium]